MNIFITNLIYYERNNKLMGWFIPYSLVPKLIYEKRNSENFVSNKKIY